MEINNESYGLTAEKIICDIYGLDSRYFIHRSVPQLEPILIPTVEQACKSLPRIIKHVGLEKGDRGGQSKSTVDFICDNNKTLSVKTTLNSNCKVCPSECGQSGRETFDRYFGHLYQGSIDYYKFKSLCLNKSHQMMPIYLSHLFDCDYLLWLYCGKTCGYRILRKKDIPSFTWSKNRFSFSRGINTWNESSTVYYDRISIGEYQVHNHRHCYKFRFNLKNLCNLFRI